VSRSLDQLTSDLSSLVEQDFIIDPYGVIDRLRAASQEILALPQPLDAAPAMFELLERFPAEHFGTPGPLVGALEEIPGYEPLLRESVARKPTQHTVWMVNRLLNSPLDEATRAGWTELLESVLQHPEVDEGARESAVEFLEFQRKR
jgi:hypothetical protein